MASGYGTGEHKVRLKCFPAVTSFGDKSQRGDPSLVRDLGLMRESIQRSQGHGIFPSTNSVDGRGTPPTVLGLDLCLKFQFCSPQILRDLAPNNPSSSLQTFFSAHHTLKSLSP